MPPMSVTVLEQAATHHPKQGARGLIPYCFGVVVVVVVLGCAGLDGCAG